MSSTPTPSTSRSNLDSIFNSAFQAYKKKTGKDITSHPLAAELDACHSLDAVLAVLRRQIPALGQSQNDDEGSSSTKWLIPTINVLYSFSGALGEGVGLAFSPAKVIFAGIGVLLLAAKDVSDSQDVLADLFNRIEYFFRRLEIYTEVPPTSAMTDIIIQIMVEVLSIVAMATKELKRGRFNKYLRKLVGNVEIEDSLQKLDKLTQEEARMAATEQIVIMRNIGNNVIGVDDRVKGVDDRIQGVSGDVQDVRNKVEDIGGGVEMIDERIEQVEDKVQGVDDKVEDIGNKVQGVDQKLEQVNRDQLRDSLFRWLSPPDPSINHNTAAKAHHDGTAQWFFHGTIFNQWKSSGNFLWVQGKPGSGKSVLCSSIIQDIFALSDAGRATIAYFYFDFKDIDKQKLQDLLPSLLIQLSARSDCCCDMLSQLYSAHDRGTRKPSDQAMIKCLKGMLGRLAQGPTYIILDALDECPITSGNLSPREEVLDFMDELVGLDLPNLHICVTSRPEPDIRAVLEPLTAHPMSLHDETGQKQDIADYVGSFVRSDRRMMRWREDDKDLVISTLSEKADGMFRWVFCQLQVLRHCFPPSVRRILDELPDTLDETYERVLREIKRANRGIAHRLMQCLVVAVRPLRVEELAEVLAFDFNAEGMPKLNPNWRWEDQEEAVMSACSSLVMIVKDGDSRIVQFSHFSVKEYLTSERLGESSKDVSRYQILPLAAHTILAQACLGVLFRLDDNIDRVKVKSFPLAGYAARYWHPHAQFENASSRIEDGIKCLFDADKPHFATWLWIHNGDHYGDGSMTTMRPGKPEAGPLYHAARLGIRSLVEDLIAKHPDYLHARGGFEMTPLHASAFRGHTAVLLLLIEHFPDVDIRGQVGQTALHRAACDGQVEAGQVLLSRGADINARDKESWTPLHGAAFFGHLEFTRMLLEHNAGVDAQDHYGQTPLRRASYHGHLEVVQLLLEHGADFEVTSDVGWVPSPLRQE